MAKATPKVEKAAKTKAPKKAAKKAETKKTVKKSEAKKADRSMADVPAPERRKALVALLQKRGARKEGTAVSLTECAEKLGYTKFDVYGLVNGTSGKVGSNPRCLVAQGIVKTTVLEGQGLSAYLTWATKDVE